MTGLQSEIFDWVLAVNTVGTYLTATISGFLGMAGGILLLAILLLTMDASIAIPVHGCVQLIGNSTRTLLFLKYCNWRIFLKFATGVIPCSFVSIYLVGFLNPISSSVLLGVFLLVALHFPKKHLDLSFLTNSFWVAGCLAGALSAILGATGPIIAPFFLNKNLSKESIIATKAACQMLVHLMKIVLFGFVLGFDFSRHALLIGSMILAGIAGTATGKFILMRHVSERFFLLLFRLVLTLIALKLLLYDGLL